VTSSYLEGIHNVLVAFGYNRDEKRFHYITAITKAKIRTSPREGMSQMELFDEKLGEVEADGVRYILRRNPERAKELARNREEKLTRIRKLLDGRNLYLS